MKKENDNEEIIYDQSKFYKDKLIPIHIKLKNGFFYNGILLEVSSTYLIIEDEKIGEFPIWFKQIYKIEPRRIREVRK